MKRRRGEGGREKGRRAGKEKGKEEGGGGGAGGGEQALLKAHALSYREAQEVGLQNTSTPPCWYHQCFIHNKKQPKAKGCSHCTVSSNQ